MSPPTFSTDIGEIRIIHRIHSENLDTDSSDSKIGHFRIIHTITTEKVNVEASTHNPCKITHSVSTAGSEVRSSPSSGDVKEFKIEHILTVNGVPPDTSGVLSESSDNSLECENASISNDRNAATVNLDGTEDEDVILDDAVPDKPEVNGQEHHHVQERELAEESTSSGKSSAEEEQTKQLQGSNEEDRQSKSNGEGFLSSARLQEESDQLSEHANGTPPQTDKRVAAGDGLDNGEQTSCRLAEVSEQNFIENIIVKTEPGDICEPEPEDMEFDFPRVTFPSFDDLCRRRGDCPATITSEGDGGPPGMNVSETTPSLLPVYSSAVFPSRQSDRYSSDAGASSSLKQTSSSCVNEAAENCLAPSESNERHSADDTSRSSLKSENRERQSCALQSRTAVASALSGRSESENARSVLPDVAVKQECDSGATSQCGQGHSNQTNSVPWPKAVGGSNQNGARLPMPLSGSTQGASQSLGSGVLRPDANAIPSTSRGSNSRFLMNAIYNQIASSRGLSQLVDGDNVPLYSQVLSSPSFSVNEFVDQPSGQIFRQRGLPPDCECGTKFRSVHDFNLHHCAATFDKRFSCPICFKRWGLLDHLKQHMKIHTGQRPHVCNVCGKAFRQSGHLTRHAVIHSGAKPYRCPVCGRGFNVSGNCQRHMRIHTAVSNVRQEYECCVCRQVFQTSTDRWYHMLTHTQ